MHIRPHVDDEPRWPTASQARSSGIASGQVGSVIGRPTRDMVQGMGLDYFYHIQQPCRMLQEIASTVPTIEAAPKLPSTLNNAS